MCNANYVRYIPPVDTPWYSTYVGRANSKYAAASTVQNPLGTNPRCPVSMCSQCSGTNCKCNMHKGIHRYWVYKWNQY